MSKADSVVFVLGMHRSGTSLLAGLLDRAGITAGHRLLPRASDNPDGFWEQTDIVGFNDLLLKHLGTAWDEPGEISSDWASTAEAEPWIEKAVAMVERSFPADAGVIGIKDPRICRLLSFWKRVAARLGRSAKFVMVVRSPAETAFSLQRRNGAPVEAGAWLWLDYNLAALSQMGDSEHLLLSFEELFTRPEAALTKTLDFLGQPVSPEATIAIIQAILKPSLRHHHPAETRELPPFLQTLEEIHAAIPATGLSAFTARAQALLLQSARSFFQQSEALAQKARSLAEADRKSLPLPYLLCQTETAKPEEARQRQSFLPTEVWTDVDFPIEGTMTDRAIHLRLVVGPGMALLRCGAMTLAGLDPSGHPQTWELRDCATEEGMMAVATDCYIICSDAGRLRLEFDPPGKAACDLRLKIRLWISTSAAQVGQAAEQTVAGLRRRLPEIEQAEEACRVLQGHLDKKEAFQRNQQDWLGELEEKISVLNAELAEAKAWNHHLLGHPEAVAGLAGQRLQEQLSREFREHFLRESKGRGDDLPGLSTALVKLPLGLSRGEVSRAIAIVLEEDAFDFTFYLRQYPDVAASSQNPLFHYLKHGWQEGRDPSALFSVSYYLEQSPDLREKGVEPLLHYCLHGWQEGRWPRRNFDGQAYADSVRRGEQSSRLPIGRSSRVVQTNHALTPPALSQKARKTRRVLFVSGEPKTPGHVYRIVRLAKVLPQDYWAWDIAQTADLKSFIPRLRDFDLVWIWRHRLNSELAEFFAAAKEAAVPLNYDVDDLMIQPELASLEVIDGIRSMGLTSEVARQHFADCQAAFLAADYCSAPTAPLLAFMRTFFQPASLVPNCFDAASLPYARIARGGKPRDGKFRIGYAAGTRTHQRDFRHVLPAILRILDEFPEALLVVFPEALLLDEFPELDDYRHRIEERQVVAVSRLLEEYARFSVNLAPVEAGNPFCEAKSELKFFEAALVETPTIASPTQPFREAMEHGITGYLASTVEEWYQAMEKLVRDGEAREAMGRRAREAVLWQFGPERQRQLFLMALELATQPPLAATALWQSQLKRPWSYQQPPCGETAEVRRYENHRRARITVIIPLYNYERLVPEALHSVLEQTLPDIDLIVIDDCSTDDSLETVGRWMEKHHNRFGMALLLRHQKNEKLGCARNTAFAASETEFIFPLDADNLLLPQCLEVCLREIENSGAAFAYPAVETFGGDQFFLPNHSWDPRKFVGGNFIDAMALIRRAVWTRVGGYTVEPELLGWEDYEFWCRTVEAGFYGVKVPELLARYRVHEQSMLRTSTDKSQAKARIIERMQALHPWLDLSLQKRSAEQSVAGLPRSPEGVNAG